MRPSFYCVMSEATEPSSLRCLSAACAQREVPFLPIGAAQASACDPLPPGSLLFAPSASGLSRVAECALFGPKVATFYRNPEGPLVEVVSPNLRLRRAGVTMPRSVDVNRFDPDHLKTTVQALGGLPVVIKTGDGEGGVGVMRADSWPALLSLVEYLLSTDIAPQLEAFVPNAQHHRVVVVGDRAVASYLNPVQPDDFRSAPSDDPADYRKGAPPELAELAVRAAHAVSADLAGVDILTHPSGRQFVIEVNSPCYFPQAEAVGGVPIGLPMVDFLLAKSARLMAAEP